MKSSYIYHLEQLVAAAAPGSRLPTDTVLAGRLGVSTRTLGRWFRQLAAQGLVQRIRGCGTFRAGLESDAAPLSSPARHQDLPQQQTASQELAGHLATGIRTGDFRAGDPLPTIKHISIQFRVSYSTAVAAYRLLQQAGLVIKTGRTFWVGALKDHLHPSRHRHVFFLNFGNDDFTGLYNPEKLGRMYQRMEMELQSGGCMVRYGNTDRLAELTRSWARDNRYPDTLLFCNTDEQDYLDLLPHLKRLRRTLGHAMPRLVFDWHRGRYDRSLPGAVLFARGNILTSAARTLAAYLVRKRFGQAAFFINEGGRTWSFPAPSIPPLRCIHEMRGLDPGFCLHYAIKPWQRPGEPRRNISQGRIRRQLHTHALQSGRSGDPSQLPALERQVTQTRDFTGDYTRFTHCPAWIFDRDTDADAAIAWLKTQRIRVPEDISVITLQNDPRYFHLGLTYCGPDWDRIGYQLAHTVLGDIPVARTGKGFIRTRAAVIEKLTTI